MSESLRDIRVTDIGEFIRHQSCARRFKLNLDDMAEARLLPFFDRLFNPLDLVLQESGRQKEDEWEAQLERADFLCLTPLQRYTSTSSSQARKDKAYWMDFVHSLGELDSMQPAYGRNVHVEADIGAFHVSGDMDFLIVTWDKTGRPKLRIVECKASRRDRTYHRVQVALYHLIVCGLIEDAPVTIREKTLTCADIDCVVARIDENTNSIQRILGLQPLDRLDVEQLEEDISRLFARDGMLKRIADRDADGLEYQLNEKCDTCIFDVYCLPESGIRHGLELLGTEPSIVRALHEEGVSDVDLLSKLDLESAQARTIRNKQGFSQSLEVLKVRALTRRSTLPGIETIGPLYKVRYLPFAGYGQLPEHTIDGRRLVRVYLSVDYDYVENRVGALAAHVTNSKGEIQTTFVDSAAGWRPDPFVKEAWPIDDKNVKHSSYDYQALSNRYSKEIVRYQTSPWTGRYDKDTESEREIIEDFLHLLIDAIAAVAQTDQAPIHFYVWSKSE